VQPQTISILLCYENTATAASVAAGFSSRQKIFQDMEKSIFQDMVGQRVLVRAYASGVHFGTLLSVAADGRAVRLTDAQRVWKWSGAATLSQMASTGVSKPLDCKFSVPVGGIAVMQVEEIILLSEEANANLINVTTWKE